MVSAVFSLTANAGNTQKQPAALWHHSTALISDESSEGWYTAISGEWEVMVSHARTATKCQVATAESPAASLMQALTDIWECRVAEGNNQRRKQGRSETKMERGGLREGKGE